MNNGIDYGLGMSNIDKKTGIRFSAIGGNSVNGDVLDDICTQGRDLTWEDTHSEAIKDVSMPQAFRLLAL